MSSLLDLLEHSVCINCCSYLQACCSPPTIFFIPNWFLLSLFLLLLVSNSLISYTLIPTSAFLDNPLTHHLYTPPLSLTPSLILCLENSSQILMKYAPSSLLPIHMRIFWWTHIRTHLFSYTLLGPWDKQISAHKYGNSIVTYSPFFQIGAIIS